MSEQQEMERWERRLRWFRRSVLGDLVLPITGLAGLVGLLIAGVEAWPPYAACVGLLTSPGFGAGAAALASAFARRPSE